MASGGSVTRGSYSKVTPDELTVTEPWTLLSLLWSNSTRTEPLGRAGDFAVNGWVARDQVVVVKARVVDERKVRDVGGE